MEVVYRKKKKGKSEDPNFKRFNKYTLLTEALPILGYRLEKIKDNTAEMWQGSRCVLRGASAKTIWGYLIRMHPKRFETIGHLTEGANT